MRATRRNLSRRMKTPLPDRILVRPARVGQLRRLPEQPLLAKRARLATSTPVLGYYADGAKEIEFSMSIVRVLIVDDFDPWRAYVIQHLDGHPHVRVLGSASDGLEAVHKAEELQPDL